MVERYNSENAALEAGPDQILSRRRAQWYCTQLVLPTNRGDYVERDLPIGVRSFVSVMAMWDQSFPAVQNPEGEPQILPTLIGRRDGLFTFEFATGDRKYFSTAPLIRVAIGDPVEGRPVPFPEQILHVAREVIRVRVVNQIDRTGVDADDRIVHVSFVGYQLFPGEQGPDVVF